MMYRIAEMPAGITRMHARRETQWKLIFPDIFPVKTVRLRGQLGIHDRPIFMRPRRKHEHSHLDTLIRQRHPQRNRPRRIQWPVILVLMPVGRPPAGILEQRVIMVNTHIGHPQQIRRHLAKPLRKHEKPDPLIHPPTKARAREKPPSAPPRGDPPPPRQAASKPQKAGPPPPPATGSPSA